MYVCEPMVVHGWGLNPGSHILSLSYTLNFQKVSSKKKTTKKNLTKL
jgi:hypothetical protein